MSTWFHGRPSRAAVSFVTMFALVATTATVFLLTGWGHELAGEGVLAHVLALALGFTMLRNGTVALVHAGHEVAYEDAEGRTRYSKLGRGGAISFVLIGGALYIGLTILAVLA